MTHSADAASLAVDGKTYEYLVVPERPAGDLSVLTPMQREVALMVWQGRSNTVIASKLGCSVHTVANHLAKVFRKLGLSCRLELVEYVSRKS